MEFKCNIKQIETINILQLNKTFVFCFILFYLVTYDYHNLIFHIK